VTKLFTDLFFTDKVLHFADFKIAIKDHE